MNLAACKVPNEPCLDCSEKKLAVLGSLSCTLDIIKDPLYFCSRKISVNKKSGVLTDIIAESLLLELFAKLGGTAALPNDGIVYRLTRLLIPYNCCLTLICYTYSRDFLNIKIT